MSPAVNAGGAHRWGRWVSGLAAGLLAVAVACSSGSDDGPSAEGEQPARPAPPEELDAGDRSFYDVPDPIPAGEHGDLVRYQITGEQPEGLTRYRVMYLSETVGGEPTVVTGLVTVPAGPAPAGGRPVVTYARGSSGIADDCAISRAVDGSSPFGDLAAEAFLLDGAVRRHGFVAAVTDYQGIGGPGIHPFVHGVSEARSVLDIVRAAADLPGLDVRDDVGVMGYSQGGHAALWANQVAGEWTPELAVHGTVAGAPASELLSLAGPEGIFDGPSLALLIAGYAQEDPDLDADDLLTPEGHELVDLYATSCRPDEATVGELAGAEVLRVHPADSGPWRAALDGNVPGQASGAGPVLVVHGDADRNVPVGHSEVLRDRLCANGTPTERRVVAGADHIAGAVPTVDDGASWLAGRIAGTQPEPTC